MENGKRKIKNAHFIFTFCFLLFAFYFLLFAFYFLLVCVKSVGKRFYVGTYSAVNRIVNICVVRNVKVEPCLYFLICKAVCLVVNAFAQ